jgi:hypothetical protein
MVVTWGRSIILGADSGVTERMTFRSVAEPSASTSSHHPPVYATKAHDTRAKEVIPRSARVRGLTSMRRRGPWSPRPRRRAAAAAARRASGSGSEASEGLPRLLAAAAAARRVLLLPPPVIGKLSPAISAFLWGPPLGETGLIARRRGLIDLSALQVGLRNVVFTPNRHGRGRVVRASAVECTSWAYVLPYAAQEIKCWKAFSPSKRIWIIGKSYGPVWHSSASPVELFFLENNSMSNFMSRGESHVFAASPCA